MRGDGEGFAGEEPRFAEAPSVMPPSFAPSANRAGSSAEHGAHSALGASGEPSSETDGNSVTGQGRHSRNGDTGADEKQPHNADLVKGKKSRAYRALSSVLHTITLFACVLLCVVVVKTFFVQFFFVPSGSMENTIMTGDYVIANKLIDEADEIQRGDIVVFRDPGDWLNGAQQLQRGKVAQVVTKIGKAIGLVPANDTNRLIKRVIGIGGDRITCCSADGRVTINGEPVTEPYVREGAAPSDVPFDVTVPEGYLWVMGDNRSNSADSRFHHAQTGFGFVRVSNVEGRAWLIYYPFKRAGLLNSENSVFAHVPETAHVPENESGDVESAEAESSGSDNSDAVNSGAENGETE